MNRARTLLALLPLFFTACDGAPSVPGAAQGTADATLGGSGGGGGSGGLAEGCVPEICNGLDDDCDQAIDEQAAEAGADCGEAQGACQTGIIVCRTGAPVCVGATGPTPELCNGLDDDCDGTIDNAPSDIGEACGACGGSTQCVAGAVICDGSAPQPEICDGLDNDCNGTIDDALTDVGLPCGGVGECAPGTLICQGGQPICEGAGQPGPEICNGADDDCDGTTDEDAERTGEACDAGACGLGTLQCTDGRLGCAADAAQGEPEVCDGRDNDCDGVVDETDPQVGQPCGSDVGTCDFGELTCVAGTVLCLGGTPSVAEACDQQDNDCDGSTDEADDTRGGIPCPAIGDPCQENRNCASGTCFSDYGTQYCTLDCAADPNICPDGLTCETRGPWTVCAQAYPPCQSDRDCAAGQSCMVTPAPEPGVFGGQCRPRFADGLAPNADCGEDVEQRCASGLCMSGPNICSSLCQTPGECADGQVCSATPFSLGNGERLDLGLCLRECTRDAHCDNPDLRCQYGRQADGARLVSYCDLPYPGAAVGEPCDPLDNPPRTCDHGFCNFRGGEGYCSAGCVSNDDCLPNWQCIERAYGANYRISLCEPPR